MNALFKFEEELGGGLRCVPMAVRLKLDRAGVKLDLKAWSRFTEEERRELLDFPDDPSPFAARVNGLAEERVGERPKALPAESFPWDAPAAPPELMAKAAAEGAVLSDGRWTTLTPLQRFALIKLSRPGHENRNFLPACREFGLL